MIALLIAACKSGEASRLASSAAVAPMLKPPVADDFVLPDLSPDFSIHSYKNVARHSITERFTLSL
jgi:hypothetical protein